ncbi:MAG: nucleotide pyrophosphohydrolase [Chloroflexota bacterium]
MELKTLEAAMHKFVQEMGWYEDDSKKPQTPKNLAISLMLEAGEVLEHFQWGDEIEDKDAFSEELADVMLYLLQIASITDVDLGEAVLKKLDRNYTRDWDAEADEK